MSYTPMPIFIPYSSDSAGDRQVDFFCKTEENKTQAEEQYCNDYFESENYSQFMNGIILIILLALIAYVIWDLNK
jgi:hypothetical protein